ncbi:MAG: glycolate oxidase subunit GlcF [Pseudomonadota bacterium]
MQINLAAFIKDTAEGREADAILRGCVHSGSCTATYPTYQVLGDELDGPRGCIYLIKQVLQGKPATASTQSHLDRCLTCSNCKTTCPSEGRHSRLLDIGRAVVDAQVAGPLGQRMLRAALRSMLIRTWLFNPALIAGQAVRAALPPALKAKVSRYRLAGPWPRATHTRKMLVLDGCVQPGMASRINAAAARVLDALGVQLLVADGSRCCGAIRQYLGDQDGALDDLRRNIDAWWPHVAPADGDGVEAIVMTASGCGVMLKEYGVLLAHDPLYADKAARIAALTRDLSEVLPQFEAKLAARLGAITGHRRVSYHPPCTLQQGQKITGKVESCLRLTGIDITRFADSHLCCGSAGTYSVLQPALAYRLRDDKLAQLHGSYPDTIVSANIGCLTHLQSGTDTPVLHWIELIDDALQAYAIPMLA